VVVDWWWWCGVGGGLGVPWWGAVRAMGVRRGEAKNKWVVEVRPATAGGGPAPGAGYGDAYVRGLVEGQSGDGGDGSSVASQPLDLAAIKEKQAWEMAQAPVKSIMMTSMMMFMSGSGIQIFSIMATAQAIFNPLKAVMSASSAFAKYKDADGRVDTLPPMLLYIALNCAGLGLGLWKLNGMGLLPTHASDWIGLLSVPESAEISVQATLRGGGG